MPWLMVGGDATSLTQMDTDAHIATLYTGTVQATAPTAAPKWTEVWKIELIDRQALVKNFRAISVFDAFPQWREMNPSVTAAIARLTRKYREIILNAPTVDAVPVVHGRWINWGKSGTPTYENYGTCSVCHEDAEIHTEHRNYCPNCGAKMDGGGG